MLRVCLALLLARRWLCPRRVADQGLYRHERHAAIERSRIEGGREGLHGCTRNAISDRVECCPVVFESGHVVLALVISQQIAASNASLERDDRVFDASVTARALGPFAVNVGWPQLHQDVTFGRSYPA